MEIFKRFGSHRTARTTMNQNQTQNPIERFNKHYDAREAGVGGQVIAYVY